MKLLTRLRSMELNEWHEARARQDWLEYDTEDGHQDELLAIEDKESEHMGIGAAMLEDIDGMGFFDSRRRIPEIHEEMLPQGFALMDGLAEMEG